MTSLTEHQEQEAQDARRNDRIERRRRFTPHGDNGRAQVIDGVVHYPSGDKYPMVHKRLIDLRKVHPNASIRTSVVRCDENSILVMVSIFDGHGNHLGDGLALERRDFSKWHATSFVEIAQTSALGRAIGVATGEMASGGLCGAEERLAAEASRQKLDTPVPTMAVEDKTALKVLNITDTSKCDAAKAYVEKLAAEGKMSESLERRLKHVIKYIASDVPPPEVSEAPPY